MRLRPFRETDLANLVKYANNPKIAQNLTDAFPHPYTEVAGKAFIQMALKNSPPNILAITIEDEFVGGIGLHPQADIHRLNAELGYWLAEPFWGQGIVTQAIKEMIVYGFANLPIERIFARPFGSNIASQRVLEKAGFSLEARLSKTLIKNGLIEDELIYAVRKP